MDHDYPTSISNILYDLKEIPKDVIAARASRILSALDTLIVFEVESHIQDGISSSEMEHLQWALGHGPWEKLIFIKEKLDGKNHF